MSLYDFMACETVTKQYTKYGIYQKLQSLQMTINTHQWSMVPNDHHTIKDNAMHSCIYEMYYLI